MKNVLEEMRKKIKNKKQEMSYSMTHYCTAIFGSQKPLGKTDCSQLHVGNKCVVVEHTAETIFIYASKTLDAELDLAWQEKG